MHSYHNKIIGLLGLFKGGENGFHTAYFAVYVKVSVSIPTLIFMCRYFIIWLILKQFLSNTPKLICAYFATDSEMTFTLYKAILWTKDLFDIF